MHKNFFLILINTYLKNEHQGGKKCNIYISLYNCMVAYSYKTLL